MNRRIAFAITLSVLIHAAILWLPQIRLPRNEVKLPPLTAKLEVMPEHVVQSAKPEPAKPATKPGGTASTQPTVKAGDEMEELAAHHLFPNHARLTFAVYKGVDGFKIGDVHHRLEINVTFDKAAQKLHFSRSDETPLIDETQDALSYAYQLSQLSMHVEIIPLAISDGRQLENDRIEIGGEEDILTSMGKVRALHLRKMHAQGEAYFEIWLGLEYRLLPVKFRQIDSSGEVTEEVIISDIRVADE